MAQASHYLSRGAKSSSDWEALNSRLRQRAAAEDGEAEGEDGLGGNDEGDDDGGTEESGKRRHGSARTSSREPSRRNSDVSIEEMDHSLGNDRQEDGAQEHDGTTIAHAEADNASLDNTSRVQWKTPSSTTIPNESRQRNEVKARQSSKELERTVTYYEDEMDSSSVHPDAGSVPARRRRTRKTRVISQDGPSDLESSMASRNSRQKGTSGRTKLGTFEGVFLPVVLNVESVIMFLRFGFVIAQTGLYGALSLTALAYAVDLLTVLSVSAIATNGTVRGGGLYYLISRTLGPEFGGSIGLVYYLGLVLNSGMNVVAFVESLTASFGVSNDGLLPEGWSWGFLYGTLMLLVCTICCLVGSKAFGKLTLAFAAVAFLSNVSIPLSSLVMKPFSGRGSDGIAITYTSWKTSTFRDNLFPHFTSHSPASGAHEGYGKRENWQTVFGVLYPAVAGVLAGTSLSGDLKTPSKSIPRGTLQGLAFTGLVYVFVFLTLAGTVTRTSLEKDLNILKDISLHRYFIIGGVLGSSVFSTLVGTIGAAKMLQAIARDNLLPSLLPLAQGSGIGDDPVYAIGVTWALTQLVLFSENINDIASLVSMTTLLAFGVINLACFMLRLGAAPNFRPSFHYFSTLTAGSGVILCLAAMFFVDVLVAALSLILMAMLFTIIHYLSPPKMWGDVTQGLIYHQVRKYLLRLDSRKEHVKFWRPQILMLVNGPPRIRGVYRMPEAELNLVHLCNALKKGSLYVLGHAIIGNFKQAVPELRRLQSAWLKFVETTKIKAFVNITVASDERSGARNLILGSGLGGMRPNIVVLGFPDFASSQTQKQEQAARRSSHSGSVTSTGSDSTIRASPVIPPPPGVDSCRYVGMIEDILSLNKSLAVGVGMAQLQLPSLKSRQPKARFIDLWPIRMSVPEKSNGTTDAPPGGESAKPAASGDSHAFDSYTMILQMGTVLHMVEDFEDFTLRCQVFVEHASEVKEERERIEHLLDNLRIPAELHIHCLDALSTYQYIINGRGDEATKSLVGQALRLDPWWQALYHLRNPSLHSIGRQTNMNARHVRPSSRSKSPHDIFSKSLPSSHRTAMRLRLGGLQVHKLSSPSTSDGEHYSSDDDEDDEEDEDYSDDEASRGSWRAQSWRRAKSFSIGERTSLLSSSSNRRNGPSVVLEDANKPRREPGRYGTLLEEEDRHRTPRPRPRPRSVLGPSRSPSSVSQRQKESDDEEDGRDASLHSLTMESIEAAGRASERQQDNVLFKTPTRSRTLSDTSGVSGGRTGFLEPMAAALTTPVKAGPGPADTPSFDDLPLIAQHLIINEIFRTHSAAPTTLLCLTTLPAPDVGTSEYELSSRNYVHGIQVLCQDVAPTMLVHAKVLSVTMTL